MTTFFVTLLLVAGATGYMAWKAYYNGRLVRESCASLIQKMYYVRFSDVHSVARDSSQESSSEQLIDVLGGVDGLSRLRFNAKVMLDTAKYLTLIDPEGEVLAQQLRREATEIRRLVLMVLLQHRVGLSGANVTRSVQQLSKLYIRATKKHLTMCDRLIDDVLLLLQLINSTQANILRPGVKLV